MPPRSNIIAGAAALAVVLLMAWAQDDDSRRIADQQDAEALSSRDWAGQKVCGPNKTAVWEDDKTLRCFKNLDKPVRVAEGRP